MRLHVLGSNGTYPTPGRPASGYVVEDGDALVWLDAGPGTFPAALLLDVPDRVDALVLSHVHPDHCADVFPLLNHLRYGDGTRDRPLPLFAPRGVVDRLAAFLGAGPDHDFHRLFDVRLAEPGAGYEVGGLEIGFGAAAHSVPAVVTSVEGSARLVYSGDTGPDGDLAATASGADLLLCEATWQGDPPDDRYPYHLYASEAGGIARDAGVGMLVVTHVAPTLDPAVSVAEAGAVFDGPVSHAEPGTTIETKGNA